MKKIVLILLLVSSLAFSQRSIDFQQDLFFTQAIDPGLDLDKLYIRGTFNESFYKAGVNIPIETKHETFSVGAYTEQERYGSEYNLYLSKAVGRFSLTLFVGKYYFFSREATIGGFAATYKYPTGYIGVKVRDLYDVKITSDPDQDLYTYYESTTPELYLKQGLIHNRGAVLSLLGTVSYHHIQKFRGNVILELSGKQTKVGFGLAKTRALWYVYNDFGPIALFASISNESSIGLNINID